MLFSLTSLQFTFNCFPDTASEIGAWEVVKSSSVGPNPATLMEAGRLKENIYSYVYRF